MKTLELAELVKAAEYLKSQGWRQVECPNCYGKVVITIPRGSKISDALDTVMCARCEDGLVWEKAEARGNAQVTNQSPGDGGEGGFIR